MAKITRTVVINGKKQWIRANTEQEYANKVYELFGTGTPSKETKHPFSDYAENWFEVYSKPNISESTINTYELMLTKYLLPTFGDKPVEEITPDDIQRLFNSVKRSKATKDKIRMVLNQILKSAVEDEIITRNPLQSSKIRIVGKRSKVTETYTVEQMQYLIQHLDDIQRPLDRMYMALQALHPLRLEEVLGLQWEDIDTENMLLHIRRAVTHPNRNQPKVKEPKTKSSLRTIGLSSLTLPYLTAGQPKEFVLGGSSPLSYMAVRRICERVQKDTGFPEKIIPIRFRTTILTDIYNTTKDVKLTQYAAGHTTAAMTMKHYVKGRESLSKATSAIEQIYKLT